MIRGRLIFPFLAEMHLFSTHNTARDPDGAGPLTSGYDDDFRESVVTDRDDDGIGERVRGEFDAFRIPCQVEPETLEALSMFAAGNSPRSLVRLVVHFADLERVGLVDPTNGDALVRVGDRLGALVDRAGTLVQVIRNPPGLFVTEVRPIGFGLWMPRPKRNLLLVTFESRRTAAPRGV